MCVRAQSDSGRVGQLRAGVHEKDGVQGGRGRRGKGRVVATWMRERITWFGYVAQSAASPEAPDMSVYSVLDCT